MKRELDDLTKNMMSPDQKESLMGLQSTQLDNVTWHDFTEYQYVIDPIFMRKDLKPIIETTDDLDKIMNFTLLEKYVGDYPEIVIFLRHFGYFIGSGIISWAGGKNDKALRVTQMILETVWRNPELLATLAEYYWIMDKGPPQMAGKITSMNYSNHNWCWHMRNGLRSRFYDKFSVYFSKIEKDLYPDSSVNKFPLTALFTVLDKYYMSYKAVYRLHESWIGVGELARKTARDLLVYPPEEYGFPSTTTYSLLPQIFALHDALKEKYQFEIYRPYTWNIGLQIVYRQEWRPLGNQRGEIIRTIPLGPKQLEKVSTKVVRRTKVSKTSEDLKSVETTTETSDTTKDSSEIVNEAANSFGWHMEAGASVNVWGVSASISGGMQSNAENKSRAMNNKLSEAMQKTASKMRKETKIVVTTESEVTEEMTTASDIQNPNEEIPITYVYSKLQRQYEIMTSLAEVHNVIMIAEPIPPPDKVNFYWVKKHDWKITKVLLDDSFREILNSITHDTETAQSSIDETSLKKIMDNTMIALTNLAGNVSQLSLSDIGLIKETQQGYRDFVKEQSEREKQTSVQNEKRERFYRHIRENILHYCRAIWSHEDSQQRQLRYKRLNIKVPVKWNLVGTYDTNSELFEGEFIADENGAADITDLMNPAGPIGYHGNYAIYFLKPEFAGEDTFEILDVLKLPYVYDPQGEAEAILMDPLLKKYTIEKEDITPDKIDIDIREEMVEFVPELRLEYAMARNEGEAEVDELFARNELFVKYYPEYLFRKEQVRRFVLDTNNLIVDIEPGTGTALEGFKLAHRALDIQKAYQEKEMLELDNQKRRELLKKDIYEDEFWPDSKVEKTDTT